MRSRTTSTIFFHQIAADLCPLADSTMGLLVSDFFTDHIAVERKVGHINVHKPSGPDRLLNLILRDFCSQLSWLVCAIFNALIRAAILPE